MNQNLNIITISKNKNFSIGSFNNQKFLIYLTDLDKKYLLIPSYIKFSVDEKNFNFTYELDNIKLFNDFSGLLNLWLKNIKRLYRKSLFLKGLGYKVSISDDKKFLQLKLGFSHNVSIEIPSSRLIVKLNKNFITIEGFDPVEVGNFASKIRCLKTPDSYKGKGVWYKNEIRTLKELKKK
jgi:ribosomal protein L6P/L9E